MMKKIIILVLLLLVLGCKKEKQAFNDDIIQIDVDFDTTNDHNLNSYFQYCSHIVLETIDESLIAQIDKIDFFDQKIFILDSNVGSIFIFDEKGKYLSKISKKGQGSMEYITLDDFFIDYDDKTIYLYDGTSGRIINYNFSGNFIKEYKVEKGYSLFRLNNGDYLIYLGNGAGDINHDLYNLKLYGKDLKLIEKFLPFNKNMAGRIYSVGTTKSIFSKYDNDLYILPLLSNTIYTYNEDGNSIEAKYIVNFKDGKNIHIDEKSSSIEVENFRLQLNTGEIASKMHNFYKINNVIFFQFFYQKRQFFCLYNQSLNEIKCTNKRIFDDNGLFFDPVTYFSYNKGQKILSIIDSGGFEFCKKKDTTNNAIIKEIDKSIAGIEDANPILIWYNLNELKD